MGVSSDHSSTSAEEHQEHGAVVAILAPFVVLGLGSVFRFALRNLAVPYSVILLVFGALLGMAYKGGWNDSLAQSLDTMVDMDPHLLLHIFLPALIFESAFSIDWHVFNKCKGSCLYLAGPGLLASTFFLGWLCNSMLIPASYLDFGDCSDGAGWVDSAGYLLGVVLSATDPVAVVALFRELGVADKLSTVIEGESLLNDGTALVIFTVLVPAVEGRFDSGAAEIAWTFTWMSLGGAVFGAFAGALTVFALGVVFNDALVEITATLVSAYLTFYLAENALGVSGVLAVVALGLYMGRRGTTTVSPEVLHFLHEFWEMLAYFGNTLVFVIAGTAITSLTSAAMLKDAWISVLIYAAAHLVRAGVAASVWVGQEKVLGRPGAAAPADLAAGVWGGLRGAVGLALALMVHGNERICQPIRDTVLFHCSALVFLTVVVNGTTMRQAVHWLGLDRVQSAHLLALKQAARALRQSEVDAEARLRADHAFDAARWAEVHAFYFRVPHVTADRAEVSLADFEKILDHEYRQMSSGAHHALGDMVDPGAPQTPAVTQHRRHGGGLGRRVSHLLLKKKESSQELNLKHQASSVEEIARPESQEDRDARHRLLMACKASYSNQFNDGIISDQAVRILKDATEEAIDNNNMNEWEDSISKIISSHPSMEVTLAGSGSVSKLRVLKALRSLPWAMGVAGLVVLLTVLRAKLPENEDYFLIYTSFLAIEVVSRAYCTGDLLAYALLPCNAADLLALALNVAHIELAPRHGGLRAATTALNYLRLGHLVSAAATLRRAGPYRRPSAPKAKDLLPDEHRHVWGGPPLPPLPAAEGKGEGGGSGTAAPPPSPGVEGVGFWGSLAPMERYRRHMLTERMTLAFEVAKAFHTARGEALEALGEFLGGRSPAYRRVRRACLRDLRVARRALVDFSKWYGDVATSVATAVAARSVLNVQRRRLGALRREGLLSAEEFGRMEGQIEHQMARLMFSPKGGYTGKAQMLSQIPWLENVSKESFHQIKQSSHELLVPQDSHIIRQNEENESIYIVGRGTVAIFDENHNGHTVKLGEAGVGSILGEISFCLRQRRTASVKATCPSLLYRVDGRALRALADRDPALDRGLWEACAPRIAEDLMFCDHCAEVCLSRRKIREKIKNMVFYHPNTCQRFEFRNGSMVVLVSGVAKVLDSKAIVSRPPEPTAVENGNDKMEGLPPLKSAGGGERTSNNNTASITLGQDDRIMKIHAPCIIRATVQDKGFFTVEFSNDARLMTEETCFYIHTEKGSAMLGMVDQKGAAVSTSPERSPINLQTVMEEFEDDEDLEVLPGEFATDGGFSLAAPVLLSPKALPAPLDLLGAPSNNTPEENKNFFPKEPDTPAAGAIAVPTNMFGSRAAVHRFFAAAGGSGSPRRGSGLLLQKGYSFGKTGSKNHRKGFGGGGSSTPGGVAPAPSPCHKIEEEERPEVDEDEEEHPLEAHV